MYKNLRATVRRALDDPRVVEAQSAMIYKDGEEFSYEPASVEKHYFEERGNEFIRLMVIKGVSPHWQFWCSEARKNEPYISALVNGELIESDEEQ
jgi:hypothetical protein